MKILITAFKVLLQSVAAFISAIVIYLTIVMIGALIPSSGENQGDAEVQVFIQSNGVHTDVCMPSRSEWFDWTGFIDTTLYPNNSSFDFVAIGWGDKGFFLDTPTWAELKVSTALSAIFLPSPCAMHVEYKDFTPETSEMVFEEHISAANYRSLIEYITSSFVLKDERPIYIPGTSYWGTDHFFEATGNYHMFNTCNSWTNGALKSAGLRTAAFAAFPSVIVNYRK